MFKILLSLVISLWLLGGCASTSIQSTTIDYSQPLPVDEGVVTLQVINNTDRLAAFHKGWTEVIAVRIDNQERKKQRAIKIAKEKAQLKGKEFNEDDVDWDLDVYSFQPVDEGTIDSQMFLGRMPAGEYVISSLYSFFSNGEISSWISMPVFYSTGKFKVEGETLTDLGTIIFQPLLSIKDESFWSNRSTLKAFVTRSFEAQALGQYILASYPAIAQQVASKPTLTWEEDELDEFREKLSKLAIQNAFANTEITFNNSQSKALAAKFGKLNRLKNTQWETLNLPTNSQLYTAYEVGNTLYLGSELGQLFESQNLTDWQTTQPVSQQEAIVWFGETDEYTYALTSAAKRFELYQISDMSLPWKAIGTFLKKDPNNWLVQNGGLFTFVTQDGVVRVINDNKRFDFNESTGNWTNARTTSLRSFSQLPNGLLLAVEVSQWDGVGSQVISSDDGETWESLDRLLSWFGDNKADVSLPAVTASGEVVTLGRAGRKSKKTKRELKIISTPLSGISGKQKWQSHGTPKEGCHTMLPKLTSNEQLFFLCDQGQVISTADFGFTWTTEIDRNISHMQSEYETFVSELDAQREAEKAEAQNDN